MADREKESEMQSERKVGVYVCRCGGNISDHVDVEKVCEEASKIPGVVVARQDMFMCSDPGQDLIIEDLKNGTIEMPSPGRVLARTSMNTPTSGNR